MASAGRILIMPKGDYDANSTYENLDLVKHKGTSWLAKKESKGIEPSEANADYWQDVFDMELANNLTTEEAGYALDAMQGKVLDGKIAEVNKNIPSKPFISSAQVDMSTDYDTVVTAGVYFYNSWAGEASTGKNQPETTGSMGSMLVIAYGGNRDQVIFSQSGIFFRRYNGTEWNAWKSISW
jgi:hypothetical protein